MQQYVNHRPKEEQEKLKTHVRRWKMGGHWKSLVVYRADQPHHWHREAMYISSASARLKVIYTNTDGVVVNGKELSLKIKLEKSSQILFE